MCQRISFTENHKQLIAFSKKLNARDMCCLCWDGVGWEEMGPVPRGWTGLPKLHPPFVYKDVVFCVPRGLVENGFAVCNLSP